MLDSTELKQTFIEPVSEDVDDIKPVGRRGVRKTQRQIDSAKENFAQRLVVGGSVKKQTVPETIFEDSKPKDEKPDPVVQEVSNNKMKRTEKMKIDGDHFLNDFYDEGQHQDQQIKSDPKIVEKKIKENKSEKLDNLMKRIDAMQSMVSTSNEKFNAFIDERKHRRNLKDEVKNQLAQQQLYQQQLISAQTVNPRTKCSTMKNVLGKMKE